MLTRKENDSRVSRRWRHSAASRISILLAEPVTSHPTLSLTQPGSRPLGSLSRFARYESLAASHREARLSARTCGEFFALFSARSYRTSDVPRKHKNVIFATMRPMAESDFVNALAIRFHGCFPGNIVNLSVYFTIQLCVLRIGLCKLLCYFTYERCCQMEFPKFCFSISIYIHQIW